MSEKIPKSDPIGGAYNLGPNPTPGGALDVDGFVPPYEGRTTGDDRNQATRESVERQLVDAKGSTGATASPAQESPAGDDELTDAAPDSAKGVGVSTTRRGEDASGRDGKEAGRTDESGDAMGRPAGRSDKRDITGVG